MEISPITATNCCLLSAAELGPAFQYLLILVVPSLVGRNRPLSISQRYPKGQITNRTCRPVCDIVIFIVLVVDHRILLASADCIRRRLLFCMKIPGLLVSSLTVIGAECPVNRCSIFLAFFPAQSNVNPHLRFEKLVTGCQLFEKLLSTHCGVSSMRCLTSYCLIGPASLQPANPSSFRFWPGSLGKSPGGRVRR